MAAANSPISPRSLRDRPSGNGTTQRNRRPESWPTAPASEAAGIVIDPAPTMNGIHGSLVGSRAHVENNSRNDNLHNEEACTTATSLGVDASRSATAVSLAATESSDRRASSQKNTHCFPTHADASVEDSVTPSVPLHQHPDVNPTHQITRASQEVTASSPYLPFMGYVDEQGRVHTQSRESFSANDRQSTLLREEESLADAEEETNNAASVEDVLQASLNFERSNQHKRFSSSLDRCYSSLQRHLYPSVDDIDSEQPGRASSKRQSSSTCSDVITSTARASESAAIFMEGESLVPEPPRTEPIEIAADYERDSQCDGGQDEDEEKIGVAGAAVSPDRAYAVASLDSVAEATVMETSQTPEETLLRKLEAEDAQLLALKRSAYWGEPTASAAFPDQQATVVAITEHDVHPSELSNDAVAELIGEDYSNISSSGAVAAAGVATASNPSAAYASATDAVLAVEEPCYAVVDSEATIIGQQSHWHASQAEEATVMNDESTIPYADRKLPAVPTAKNEERLTSSRDRSGNDEGVAMAVAQGEDQAPGAMLDQGYSVSAVEGVALAEEEAEVVGISEEYHPSEISGNEAQAELVGALAASQDHYEHVQAATVVGYEDDHNADGSAGVTRAHSYGGPTPERVNLASRAYTSPSAVGSPVSADANMEAATTHGAVVSLEAVVEEGLASTLDGSPWEQPVVVVQAAASNTEQSAGVAVASLEAYSSAPGSSVGGTEHCLPSASNITRTTSQPAVPVASLSAYASAPAPAFDPTDCRLMNQRPIQPRTSTGEASESSDISEPVMMPPPRSFNSNGPSSDAGDGGSACSSASNRGGFQKISSSIARGMELLFGDTKPTQDEASVAQSVHPRELLPWSVIHSEATNMWVATVNTNQKALDSKNVVEASKSLRAFSVVTERQATCLAKAWSPPRMHPFSRNPACHICTAKFAVFRRACHCRNCGCVCCPACVVPWPSKMVPETYNIKKESFINICKSCDWLCTSFRLALLEGNRDKAIALHATGNVNLVTAFANVKGELFYPVHCAALGGDLELLKWLVDENCCPIKSVRVSGRCRDSSNSFTEISTSKGRSLLGIALENCNVGIVRYLVVEKGIQLAGEKDITMDTLCRNLDLVLRFLPEDATNNPGVHASLTSIHRESPYEEQAPTYRDRQTPGNLSVDETASEGSVSDTCIICFDAQINCVATPCGHQICCIECSKNISRCPVCAAECTFMRVFRP